MNAKSGANRQIQRPKSHELVIAMVYVSSEESKPTVACYQGMQENAIYNNNNKLIRITIIIIIINSLIGGSGVG